MSERPDRDDLPGAGSDEAGSDEAGSHDIPSPGASEDQGRLPDAVPPDSVPKEPASVAAEPADRSTLRPERSAPTEGIPAGQVYDWYRRARTLHDDGDPAAAVELLLWAVAAEPRARSVREALARAQFDARRFRDSAANFGVIVDEDPADHYAQFGLGLAASRSGDLDVAVNHLALAVALRPDLPHYEKALRSARAAVARQSRPLSDEGGDAS